MTQPDIYTTEARRRLGAGAGMNRAIETLAATLREFNWRPPADPDIEEAAKIIGLYGIANPMSKDGILAAIKRGRELERGE